MVVVAGMMAVQGIVAGSVQLELDARQYISTIELSKQ